MYCGVFFMFFFSTVRKGSCVHFGAAANAGHSPENYFAYCLGLCWCNFGSAKD